jgi:cobalt-zinc-cadmium efflux system outer membrane protein
MPLLPSWAAVLVALSFDSSPTADRCRGGPLDRAAVIHCAQLDNPLVEADRAALQAVDARKRIARVALPSQPELELSGAARKAAGIPRNWNIYATLRQELEVGGQRRRRMDVAEAEHELVDAQVRTTRQDVTADALLAYYDVLAARERRGLVEQAQRISAALASLAKGRMEAGAEAGLSADLAEIAAVTLDRRVLDQARDEAVAKTRLARSLGLEPAELPEVVGELAPVDVRDVPADASERTELDEAAAELRLRTRETALIRRALVPNPRLSLFVQRDGFAELVLGAGVSLPLPVPAVVGPLAKGRAALAQAREREAARGRDAVSRGVRLEADLALAELRARQAIAALYERDTLTRARADLDALATALADGRFDVRSALLAQQQLIEFIEADIDARHALCVASIVAARALGLDWKEQS